MPCTGSQILVRHWRPVSKAGVTAANNTRHRSDDEISAREMATTPGESLYAIIVEAPHLRLSNDTRRLQNVFARRGRLRLRE